MQAKLFEIRDKGTFVPVVCVLMESDDPQEKFLLGRAGYGRGYNLVWLAGLAGHPERATYNPFEWGDRTRAVAHQYITDHWATLVSGAVVDVEYILGERETPKQSERVTTCYQE